MSSVPAPLPTQHAQLVVRLVSWQPPVRKMAKKMFEALQEEDAQILAKLWREMHTRLQSDTLVGTRPTPERRGMCHNHGFCTCRRPMLRSCVTALQRHLRRIVEKDSKEVKLLLSGWVVVHVCCPMLGESRWWGLTHVDRLTWSAALVQLEEDPDHIRRATAQAHGRRALRVVTPIRFETWWQGFANLDIRMPWECVPFLAALSERVEHHLEFVPGRIQVEEMMPIQCLDFWNETLIEKSVKKPRTSQQLGSRRPANTAGSGRRRRRRQGAALPE